MPEQLEVNFVRQVEDTGGTLENVAQVFAGSWWWFFAVLVTLWNTSVDGDQATR